MIKYGIERLTDKGEQFDRNSFVCIPEEKGSMFLCDGLIFSDIDYLYKTRREAQEEIDNVLKKEIGYFYPDFRRIKDMNSRIVAVDVENKKIIKEEIIIFAKKISRWELMEI